MNSERYKELKKERELLDKRRSEILKEMEAIELSSEMLKRKKYVNTLWCNTQYGTEYIFIYDIDKEGRFKSIVITCFQYDNINIHINPNYLINTLHLEDSCNKQYPVIRLDKKIKKILKTLQGLSKIIADAAKLPFTKLRPQDLIY